MSNFIEDTINFGFGVFAYSREKIEAFVESMVEKGEVSKNEASKCVSRLVEKGEAERREITKMVRDEVRQAVDAVTPITKDDIRAIIREEMDAAKAEK